MDDLSSLTRRTLIGLFVALHVMVLPGAVAARESQDAAPSTDDRSPEIQLDPAVRSGVLANGLRYSVRSNARPVSGLSMRLEIRAGSQEEEEAVRGAAHFLEHMAFNGSAHFAETELQTRFAEAGVAFGRDQNAYTTGFRTVYKVDFVEGSAERTALGLLWLRDIADGLSLEADAVERERGVVLAEYRQGLGPGFDWSQRYLRFVQPNLRSTIRPPLGVPETLAAIDADDIRAFYRAWYRPEQAIVSLAGDQPLDELERLVSTTFGDWRSTTPAPVRAAPGVPDPGRGLSILTSDAPGLSQGIGLCRIRGWTTRGEDSVARRRFYRERAVWREILNRRLRPLAVQETSNVLSATFANRSRYQEAEEECVGIQIRGDDWRNALAVTLREVRLFDRDGVTEAEVRRVLDAQREAYVSAVAGEADLYSATVADNLLADQSDDRGDPSTATAAAEDLRLFDLAAATIDPDTVMAAFRDSWSGSGPLIALTLPEGLPTEDEIRAAFEAAMTVSLPAPVAAVTPADWAYTDFGPPGEVIARTVIEDPGFVRLVFASGVVVNFKSVSFSHDTIDVGVRLGFGFADVADSDFNLAGLGSALLPAMGLGRHDLLQLSDLNRGRQASATLSMAPDAFVLSGSTRSADFERQMQYLAAELTDPGFRPDFLPAMRSLIQTLYRTLPSNPGLVLEGALTEAIAPRSPRSRPPEEDLLALAPQDFRRVLSPILLDSPLEVTVVGDVSEERAIKVLARTLGALPARAPREPFHPDGYRVHYPEGPVPDITATHAGDPQQALVAMIWPLWTGEPDRRAEQRRLALLSRIVNERIRIVVREQLGLSYAPSATLTLRDFGDQGTLSMVILTDAAEVERTRAALRAVQASLITDPVTASELEKVRGPMLARVVADRATNGWWYGAIAGSARDPWILRDAIEWPEGYRAIGVEELNVAAAEWLDRAPIVAIVVPAAAEPPAPAGP